MTKILPKLEELVRPCDGFLVKKRALQSTGTKPRLTVSKFSLEYLMFD